MTGHLHFGFLRWPADAKRLAIGRITAKASVPLAATLLAFSASAQQTQPVSLILGEGIHSCARAFSDESQNYSYAWILGYFTGVNKARHLMVGSSTDGSGVVGEVKLVCEAQPSIRLDDAAGRVYARMLQLGR